MLEQGEILRDRYRVIRRLGQGGMGAVYEAHDNVFDTSVALKEVTIDLSSAYDTEAQDLTKLAFEREAKLLAKISHETIPHVKDYFIEKDAQFLVMELVDGDDLAKLLKQRNAPFPVGTIIEWTDQLLDALDYLHNQNPPIIHRDIKPQNLKLTTRKKIKLLDFGIAKGTESKSANTITNQTFIAATLNYSPIEQMIRVLDPTFLAVITHKYSNQIEGLLEQNADVRTDIFALGATLYHLSTNKHPAEAVKRGIDVWDGKPDPLEYPGKLNPEIPKDFSEFLLKSMQINREHRFGSALEMRTALEQVSRVITKPSMAETVQLTDQDLHLQDTQTDFTPPSTAQDSSIPIPVTPPVSADSAEIKTEVAKPLSSQPTPSQTANQKTQQLNSQQLNSQQQFNSQPQNFSSATSPTPQRKKSNKLLWLIPVAGLILIMFVGGVLGVWLVVRNFANNDNTNLYNSETSNTNTGSENDNSATNTESLTSGNPLGTNDTTNSDENTENDPVTSPPEPAQATPKTTRPTPVPTRKSTPRPTPVVKPKTPRPTPVKTPIKKKTPKNMDCIFTDSCE